MLDKLILPQQPNDVNMQNVNVLFYFSISLLSLLQHQQQQQKQPNYCFWNAQPVCVQTVVHTAVQRLVEYTIISVIN